MMRVLLDENMPQVFRFELPGHDVTTAGFMRFAGLSNGALIAAMVAAGIQVLITLDKNLQYQQRVAKEKIAVIVLQPKSTQLHDVLALAPEILRSIEFLQPGQVITLPPS